MIALTDVDGDGTDDFAEGSQPGLGFPGTEQTVPFSGAATLVDPQLFLFVADSDGDLATHETFPTGVQIRMQMTEGVKAINGKNLEDQAVASATVGPDDVSPEVRVSGSEQIPVIIPGNGDFDVDPETSIIVEFTEPIQLMTLGDLPDGSAPTLSAAILLEFGPTTSLTSVPFTVMPRSVFDFTSMVLKPVYAFPGAGPGFLDCSAFNQVTITVNTEQFMDLSDRMNSAGPVTFFTTGEGPGLVNAPVTPDAIYLSRVSGSPSLSVPGPERLRRLDGQPGVRRHLPDPTRPQQFRQQPQRGSPRGRSWSPR